MVRPRPAQTESQWNYKNIRHHDTVSASPSPAREPRHHSIVNTRAAAASRDTAMAFRIIRQRKEARRLAKIEEIFQVCFNCLDDSIRVVIVSGCCRIGTDNKGGKLAWNKFRISSEYTRWQHKTIKHVDKYLPSLTLQCFSN